MIPSANRLRAVLGVLAGAAFAAPAWAAISVSDVTVAPKPGSPALVISYRLNQPATSVQINISNGSVVNGPTNKGMNTVEVTPPGTGLTATITATAAADSGTGGAVQLVEAIKPNLPAVAGNHSGLSFYTRPESIRRDHLVVPSGMSITSKRVQIFASDGTQLLDKDISAYGSGSYPFGVAVAQQDPDDHVYIASRSTGYIQVFETTPTDLVTSTPALRITGTSNNYTALDVTPNTNTFDNAKDFNVWLGDNKNGRIRHHLTDFSTGAMTFANADPLTVAQSQNAGTPPTPTGNDDPIEVAVDPTNRVMFKAQVHDSGVALISEKDITNPTASANLNKWISTDGGTTWTMDVTWSTNIIDFDGIPEAARVSCYGIALGKGFDANNLAASTVWIAVGGAAADPNPAVRKIYHVRADTGTIIPADTIDLDQVAFTGSIALNTLYPRYLSLDRVGNLAVSLGGTSPLFATSFTILAPNRAGPSSDTSQPFAVQSPFLVTAKPVSPATVGNSGAGSVTFAVDVYAPNGIVADNVQVKIDLSPIGGAADQALTRGTVSTDGTTATYTYTYQVPSTAPAGSFDLDVTTTRASGADVSSNVNLPIYSALVPAWSKTLDNAVKSSPVSNGGTSYIGTESGTVYAFDKDGNPVASFGAGGTISIGEPVRGELVLANGLLYVPGTTKVVIVNSGNGLVSGTATGIPNPFIAVTPFDTFDTMLNNRLIAGGSDNKLRILNATTGAQMAISADLGAAINRVAIGPSRYFGNAGELGQIVVAGTESFIANVGGTDVTGGRIYMLDPRDLSNAFLDANSQPWVIVDPDGAVRSRAAFGVNAGSPESNAFVIGGASGLWGVNTDTGALLGWTNDATIGSLGNPYPTPSPVDANPAAGQIFPSGGFTVHFATTGGNLYGLTVSNGARLSWAGDPIGLTDAGGFPAGAGVLAYQHERPGVSTNVDRRIFLGGDAADGKFYALLRDDDGSAYVATADKIAKFDPSDSLTFPGHEAASFATTPALADDHVVVGATTASNGGKLYAFPLLLKALPYVASITPANGAFNVPVNTTATLVFSQDVDPASVTSSTFGVYDTAGNNIFGSPVQGADAKTWTLDISGLTANKTYVIVVKGVKDPGGRAVPAFSSAFYTGAAPFVANDVNGDFAFNLEDVREILRIAGGLTPATAQAMAQGDKAAPSGSLTIADALALRKLLP